MKKTIQLATVFMLALIVSVNAQSRKELKAYYGSQYNVEIQTLGVGNDGTKLFKVWGYAKKAEGAAIEAKRNAISAAIFKGIPAGGGAAPTPALTTDINAEVKHQAFFDEFFKDGGKYLQFVNLSTDASAGGSDSVKMKKGYKVAVAVSINFVALRKYLEESGVIRKLDSGF
ncbi:MAG: hypothetical protein PHU27_05510 [Salinivirgaceae bacterium]|nr:hypothetical protein [Salinivirgaceae bacterium]MDD4747926.1 hypothetical protein [Salinivirgaceae bacterium]